MPQTLVAYHTLNPLTIAQIIAITMGRVTDFQEMSSDEVFRQSSRKGKEKHRP